MFKKSAVICCLAMSVFVTSGCEEDTTDLVISQFDRPQDVAFVCYDSDKGAPLPIGCCKTELSLDDRACAPYASSALLYAFVTQTTSGEVAVVDVEEQEIVDQESRIPYNTFIPVGGQPNDIAASDDGSRVYTANYETGDISVIQVVNEETGMSVIDSPYLSPATSIDLGGTAARMALVKSPERYRDRFALVTQPTLGRLTVVSLFSESCPDQEASPDGCVLGYVSLPSGTDTDDTDDSVESVHPWALTAADGQSAFVGSYDQPVLWDVQIESLVTEALALEEAGPIDPENVLNDIIPISEYTARSLSIEPVRRRWIYAIDNTTGGVFAVDLQNRVPGSGDEAEIIPVSVSGKTRSLALVQLEEEGDPGPLTFNGTFAVVATALAGFGVVDVDDTQPTTQYYRSHVMRPAVDLTDPDGGIQEMYDEPTLTVDGKSVDENSVYKYIELVEDEVDGGCDAGDEDAFKATYDNGVRFRCDPYLSRRETWSITWEGSIGVSGAGVVTNITDTNGAPWQLLNEDEAKNFCSLEVYTPDPVDGYPGDRLVITSDPTPTEGNDDYCEDLYDIDNLLAYRIVGMSPYDETFTVPNVIEFENEENSGIPDLDPKCFGQVVSYEIHASDQWVVKGSRSSYKRTAGSFIAEEGRCKYSSVSKMRMNVGEPFENDYIKFRTEYGEAWPNGPVPMDLDEQDTEIPDVEAVMAFRVVHGYEEMMRSVSGTNITDIEFTPDHEVALVDQGGEGLIIFDMLNTFSIIGGNIN